MEIYILDNLYRPIDIVDVYESFIWTERFSSAGDFQLDVISNTKNRRRFTRGTNICITASKRVMTVVTIDDYIDADNRRMLKVVGYSLEDIFKHRIIAYMFEGELVRWGPYNEVPKVHVETMYQGICGQGVINGGDVLDEVTMGSDLYPEDTIPFPTEEVVYDPDIKDLYSAIKEICDKYNMGFRIVRDPTTNLLYFDVYMGSDRTSAQETLDAVIFSQDLGNFRNPHQIRSYATYKNVAYVVNATGHDIVYADGVDSSIESFDRKVLVVVAKDELDSTQRIALGKEELAKNRWFSGIDGEIDTTWPYVYEKDYYLGDLVEIRDVDGTCEYMQVTEQIIVSDKEGDRAFPTLVDNLFITPGSWIAWDFAQEWDDLSDTLYWADLP